MKLLVSAQPKNEPNLERTSKRRMHSEGRATQNEKMSNETNFRRATINIYSAITKDYENEQPGRPGQHETNLALFQTTTLPHLLIYAFTRQPICRRHLHSASPLPLQPPPILTRKFSNVLHISQTYSSAIPPLFVSYLHLFVNFHTLKHFSTPPTPIFSPKTRVTPPT